MNRTYLGFDFGLRRIGIAVGSRATGTARPLATAMLACGLIALVLILFSERGRLFRRIHPRTR